MRPIKVYWLPRLTAILAVAILTAVFSARLPDNSYQRWQLLENTVYGNATWSFERINFDSHPIDVAIIGSSRTQLGLSATIIANKLKVAGEPHQVANLSVFEDGRNMQWAIADELFRKKHPRIIIMTISSSFHPWGHPGFKLVAPATAIIAPPSPFLNHWLGDMMYLPYRQLELIGARLIPHAFGLRASFDARIYAAKPYDYTDSQTLPDGNYLDMYQSHTAAELQHEARKFGSEHLGSHMPKFITAVTDIDDQVYISEIAKLARSHGSKVIFVYLPEFASTSPIGNKAFYASLGQIVDFSFLSQDASLYQSFKHLNHRGAMIASNRLADVIVDQINRRGNPAI